MIVFRFFFSRYQKCITPYKPMNISQSLQLKGKILHPEVQTPFIMTLSWIAMFNCQRHNNMGHLTLNDQTLLQHLTISFHTKHHKQKHDTFYIKQNQGIQHVGTTQNQTASFTPLLFNTFSEAETFLPNCPAINKSGIQISKWFISKSDLKLQIRH